MNPTPHLDLEAINQALIAIGKDAHEIESATFLTTLGDRLAFGWPTMTGKDTIRALLQTKSNQLTVETGWQFFIPTSLPAKAVARLDIRFTTIRSDQTTLSIWFDMLYHEQVLETILHKHLFILLADPPEVITLESLVRHGIILPISDEQLALEHALNRLRAVPLKPDAVPSDEEIAKVLAAIAFEQQNHAKAVWQIVQEMFEG